MEAEEILEFDDAAIKTKLKIQNTDIYLHDFMSKLMFFKTELFRRKENEREI